MLTSLKPSNRLGWLQLMLFRSWLSKLEKKISDLVPLRNPNCLLALENEKPIALLVIRPFNLRGTCWTLSFPELLLCPEEYSYTFIRQNLIAKVLESENLRTQSWLIKCKATEKDQLDIIRDFGFQPLKFFNCWSPPNLIQNHTREDSTEEWYKDFEWQELNKVNAHHLLRLQQASESSHLRQLIDHQWRDLLLSNRDYSGVLIPKNKDKPNAIAGLICRNWSEGQLTIELLRDLAWDERISIVLPGILNNLIRKGNNLILETSREDEYLTNFLSGLGWVHLDETILLGRSLWRRQDSKRILNRTKQLRSMLGPLNPQNPPLPYP